MLLDAPGTTATRRRFFVQHDAHDERPTTGASHTATSTTTPSSSTTHNPATATATRSTEPAETARPVPASLASTRALGLRALRGEGPDAVPLTGTNLFGLDRTFARARDAFFGQALRFGAAGGVGVSADRAEARALRPIDPPPATPAPTGPAPIGRRPHGTAARADWYRRIVESQGHTWRSGVNQVNVVGLRGYDVEHGRNHNRFGKWNDTMAYVWKGTDHKWHVRELRATTDPGMTRSADSPDVNHDGRGDVAWLRPGQYRYHVGTHHGVYGAGNPDRNVPVFRDTNGDGHISGAEERASRRRHDVGYGINLHWGPGYDNGNVGGYSLGCQVITGDQTAFRNQLTPIMERNRGHMLYTLVDASDVRWT